MTIPLLQKVVMIGSTEMPVMIPFTVEMVMMRSLAAQATIASFLVWVMTFLAGPQKMDHRICSVMTSFAVVLVMIGF